MSQPFIGEIRMFGFSRTPIGWQACDGSLLSIAEYDALFTLIGTTYGGDGMNSFAVPDLRGRVPVHQGQGPGLTTRVLGELAGAEQVTLIATQMPAHSHSMIATTAAASAITPGSALLPGAVSGDTFYVDSTTGNNAVAMSAQMVTAAGNGFPHENCMPTLTTQYCIALFGIWPQQA
ncbi:phage tail protein [Luteimonas kalidii]|uniref:Tail fiber protein n=1 Tax=Luteimonas kalidii TaxID=3042025 RepID=A0ABT6JRR8_9GAMM|nr:tail fiber protein [Luteimonas kalidii]MDH5833377.1 tail fiber protein [Luteimonas kalidii]